MAMYIWVSGLGLFVLTLAGNAFTRWRAPSVLQRYVAVMRDRKKYPLGGSKPEEAYALARRYNALETRYLLLLLVSVPIFGVVVGGLVTELGSVLIGIAAGILAPIGYVCLMQHLTKRWKSLMPADFGESNAELERERAREEVAHWAPATLEAHSKL